MMTLASSNRKYWEQGQAILVLRLGLGNVRTVSTSTIVCKCDKTHLPEFRNLRKSSDMFVLSLKKNPYALLGRIKIQGLNN